MFGGRLFHVELWSHWASGQLLCVHLGNSSNWEQFHVEHSYTRLEEFFPARRLKNYPVSRCKAEFSTDGLFFGVG